MLCEDCQEHEATIHFTHIADNKKQVLNLCAECAEKRGFHNPLQSMTFPLGDFLASMVEKAYPGGSEEAKHVECPGCGLTLAEFAKTGIVGCGKCYEAFHEQTDDLLRKIHGQSRHTGKMPSGSPERMEPLKEERRLQEALRKAIETEDFEHAAEIRDRLKELASERH
jgi:protein arginine kinase activator